MPLRIGTVCAAGIAVACAACTGQSLYTTPRTLSANDVQVILAPEYMMRTRAAKPVRPDPNGDNSEAPDPVGVGGMHAGLRTGVGERGGRRGAW